MIPASFFYTTAKVASGAGPGKWWDTSTPSGWEMRAGMEGAIDGIKDLFSDEDSCDDCE